MSGFGAQGFGVASFGTAWTNPTSPNITDFQNFLYTNVQIPVTALPLNSQWPQFAFNRAVALVAFYPQVTPIEYVMAVYNCGAHYLLMITPDVLGQTFFSNARTTMNLLTPETGIIQSSSDQGTGNSFAIGDMLKNLTLNDLMFMRTPWGRQYLAYAGDAGPGLWGLS